MECAVELQPALPAVPMDQPGQPEAASLHPAMAQVQSAKPPVQPWEYSLRKYLLLLATLVVTVTYTEGFNPPGASLVVIVLILILAIRHDKKGKDSQWVVVPLRLVMVLDLLSLMGAYGAGTCRDKISIFYFAVLVAIVFLYILVLKLMDCWDKNSDSSAGMIPALVASSVDGMPVNMGSDSGATTPIPNPDSGTSPGPVASWDGGMPVSNDNTGSDDIMPAPNPDSSTDTIPAPILGSDPATVDERFRDRKALKKLKAEERLRKVLMLLATFAVSITYVAGLSTPGGFWDSTGGSHHPGDAILKDQHSPRLTVFLLCNTTAFVASLLITMLLIIDGKKLRKKKTTRSRMLCGCIVVALVGLVGAYIAGSCREIDTTAYVASLVGAVLAIAHIILLYGIYTSTQQTEEIQQTDDNVSTIQCSGKEVLDKARSLVLLLATLAAAITYTAGLKPPGGLWQDNTEGNMAGDPILLTTNASRYKAFFYCNSVAFVASLVAIVLVQMEILVKHHVLEAAMILDLFGLIGAYAAGSCRDANNSIYVMALAGLVLVYVVIHVIFFTLDHEDKHHGDQANQLLEKRRKRLLLFAILAATITYQAGLTPPGGFLLQDDKLGHQAGDPVLLYNFPRRYKAFFYCNSVSFMLSISLILLLVNPNLYRPAIRSNALSVCTAVGLFCLMVAYAAGSTQHLKTSIYIFVLVGAVLFVAAGLLLVFALREQNNSDNSAVAAPSISHEQEEEEEERNKEEERKKHARRKYLMLLGILVASVAYQAGLEPPGGAWQSSGNGYEAGDPVMHDIRRPRYLVFFYSNSFSFVASIVVIMMLLPHWLPNEKKEEWEKWSLRVMNWTILLDLVTLLVAYAAGSSRGWKTSVYVGTLILAVLGYFAIHMTLSIWSDRCHRHRLRRERLEGSQENRRV
uniref:PGG domain-containing protein n=1 Tax=Aegilops tauschii TaxID=37682 RepID=M8CDQ0_AEGTA